MKDFNHDVLIVGGGLVGATLACALNQVAGQTDSKAKLKIAVVEARPLGAIDQPSYDDRTIALAYSSRRIFEGIGIWPALNKNDTTAIDRIHISDKGRFGITRLQASDAGIEALGYVAETRAIGKVLYDYINTASNIELMCPGEIETIENNADGVVWTLVKNNTQYRAKIMILADGGRSGLRESLGFQVKSQAYQQTAIVTNVSPERPHNNTAYERFTNTGPLALLPIGQSANQPRCAVVWSTAPDKVEEILAWNDEQFLEKLQDRFGWRLGKFTKAGKRQAYPLHLSGTDELVRGRVLLAGNAAHTVHPVAGQGFNMGLRDIACLVQVLEDAISANKDIAEPQVLDRYDQWRKRDNKMVPLFTDGLIGIFSNDFLPMTFARNLGLLAVDLCPPLKREFTRRTSGLTGTLPRLARGIPLQANKQNSVPAS
jgi:2-octaprenyl-6-methoxyphenol hydroxylase